MADPRQENELLDGFLNMLRNATESESGAASIWDYGKTAQQQWKLQSPQFQSEIMKKNPAFSPEAVTDQMRAESRRAVAEDVSGVVKQAALGRKNLARAAAKALIEDFPSVVGDMMNDISPLPPHNNTMEIYAERYGISTNELAAALGEIDSAPATSSPRNPLRVKKEVDVEYAQKRVTPADKAFIAQGVEEQETGATVAGRPPSAATVAGTTSAAAAAPVAAAAGTTEGQSEADKRYAELLGGPGSDFAQYADPEDAAFTSMVYSTLGPVKAGNARIMEAAKRAKPFALGHFMLATVGGKSAQKLEADPEWSFPGFLKTHKPSEFMGSPVTEEAYQSFLQGSSQAYAVDDPQGITNKADLIWHVVKQDPMMEFNVVAAREGITGRGLIGRMRLEALGKTYKYWQNEQIRDPGSSRTGFVAFWDKLKRKRGESQQVRQAQYNNTKDGVKNVVPL